MKKLRYLTTFTLYFFFSLSLNAFEFNLEDRIKTRDFYKQNFELIYGSEKYSDRVEFKRIFHTLTKPTQKKINTFINTVHPYVPEKILMPLVYWRFLRHNEEKTAKILTYLFLDKVLILRDYAEDPLYKNRIKIHNKLRDVTHINSLRTDQIFSKVFPLFKEKSHLLASLRDGKVFIQALMETDLFTLNLAKEIGHDRAYLLDHYGFIPGNKINILRDHNIDIKEAIWFNKNIIYEGGVLNFDAPYIQMPYRSSYDGHGSFLKNPIFKSIKRLIDSAEESIMMDMNLLGGTIGATVAEYILDKTKEKLVLNKNFKVLILHDYNNHHELEDEVTPIFSYLKNRITKDEQLGKSVYLLQSNVYRKVIGQFPKISKNLTHKRNDNSKVIVIDANSITPEALVGSKNLTDHKGGYFLNTATHISGPAAALVQASYIYDIEAALTANEAERALFVFKDKGFDNLSYLSRKNEIYDAFKIKRSLYPYIGSDHVRISESDSDGMVKNTRNILIDMILKANNSIYMEQRFLYDAYIVDTLIKRKISNPSLDIKIIVDNNSSHQLGGLPNTFFMSDLIKHGIEMRTKETFKLQSKFPNGKTQTFYQQNHNNLTIVDGQVAFMGSSQITPESQGGHNREMNVQVYSNQQVKRYQSQFLKDWNDDKKTLLLDIENFQAIIAGKTLSKSYSALINNMAAMIIRNKERLKQK